MRKIPLMRLSEPVLNLLTAFDQLAILVFINLPKFDLILWISMSSYHFVAASNCLSPVYRGDD